MRSTDARELKTLSGFHVWQREPASHHRVHKPDRLLFWPIRHPQRSSHRAGNAGMQMGRNRRDDPRQRRTIEEETSFLTSNPSVNSGGVDNGKQNGSNVVVRIVTLKSCFLLLPVLSHSPAPNYNAPLSLSFLTILTPPPIREWIANPALSSLDHNAASATFPLPVKPIVLLQFC